MRNTSFLACVAGSGIDGVVGEVGERGGGDGGERGGGDEARFIDSMELISNTLFV